MLYLPILLLAAATIFRGDLRRLINRRSRAISGIAVLAFLAAYRRARRGQRAWVRPRYVVNVDDRSTAILRDKGGVEFIDNDAISDRVPCPEDRDAPSHRLWVYSIHCEESLLQSLGRLNRPRHLVDRRCGAAL